MYKYEEQRNELFTESGQVHFLKIRDKVHMLLKEAGAFRIEEAIKGSLANTWLQLACIDRLKELGEIEELTHKGSMAQHRIFTYKN